MAHEEGVPCGRKTQQQAGSRVAKYLPRKKRSRESKLDGTLKAHTSDIFFQLERPHLLNLPKGATYWGPSVHIAEAMGDTCHSNCHRW